MANLQQIVVERLTKTINEDHLWEIFGQFGRIKDLDLPVNRTCMSIAFVLPNCSTQS